MEAFRKRGIKVAPATAVMPMPIRVTHFDMKQVVVLRSKKNRKGIFIFILLSFFIIVIIFFTETILGVNNGPSPGDLLTYFVNTPTYYCYRPNFQYVWVNEDGNKISIATDENGFRNPPDYLKAAEVIVLGDSYIAGVNTVQDSTLVGLLRIAGVKTYNAGVDMFSSGQALQVLKSS